MKHIRIVFDSKERKTVCLFLASRFSASHTKQSCHSRMYADHQENGEQRNIENSTRWNPFCLPLNYQHRVRSFIPFSSRRRQSQKQPGKENESHNCWKENKTNPARFPIGMHQLRWSAGVSGVDCFGLLFFSCSAEFTTSDLENGVAKNLNRSVVGNWKILRVDRKRRDLPFNKNIRWR